jgi:DNA-binding IclR family transcriptional regulator
MDGQLRRAVELVRRRGYAIAANGPALGALRQTSSIPIGGQRDEAYWTRVHKLIASLSASEVQLVRFEQAGAAGVCYISAPVFSPSGDVALELTISGMPMGLGPEEIERHAERLRMAASVVTSDTHGRVPA